MQFAARPDDPFTETRISARPRVVEGVCRRGDGSTFAVESSLASVSVGGRDCILAVVRDTKRRAHTTQQLGDFQERYRSLFDQVREAVLVTNRAGVIVEANAAALALFGSESDDFVGLEIGQWLLFKQEDVRRFRDEAVQQGRVSELPVEVRRQDGTTLTAMISATLLRAPDGSVRGYQCIVRRVGARMGGDAGEPIQSVNGAPEVGAGLVLLVTADTSMREEAERALQRAGIATVTVADAAGAAREIRARGERIGALVIEMAADRRMGRDTLREALQSPADLPIIAIGEESELGAAQRLTLGRRVEFLPPPAHPVALVQRVRAVLKNDAAGSEQSRNSPG